MMKLPCIQLNWLLLNFRKYFLCFISSIPILFLFNSFRFLPELKRNLVHFIFELNLVNLHHIDQLILIMSLNLLQLKFPFANFSLELLSFKKNQALWSRSRQQSIVSKITRKKIKRNCLEIHQSSFAFLCALMNKMISGITELGKC